MENYQLIHRFGGVRRVATVLCLIGAFCCLGFSGFARVPADTPVRRCTVTLTATEGGVTTGGGDYASETAVTLTADAMDGFVFDGWYESDNRVYNFNVYTFLITNNRSLEARFSPASSSSVTRTVTPQTMSPVSQESQEESSSQAEAAAQQPPAESSLSEASSSTSEPEPEPEPVADEVSPPEEGAQSSVPEVTSEAESKPEPESVADLSSTQSLPQTGKGVQSYLPLGGALLLAGLLCARRKES